MATTVAVRLATQAATVSIILTLVTPTHVSMGPRVSTGAATTSATALTVLLGPGARWVKRV